MTDEEDTDPGPVGAPAVWTGVWFEAHEFDCHDGTPYPVGWIPLRLTKLVAVLDRIRADWDGPILVVSGYRTLAWNARVGGVQGSQHLEGRAADVRPVPIQSEPYLERVARLHALALELWNAGELPDLGGLGYYPAAWIHVDVRARQPVGHLAQWTGSGYGSEQT